MKKNDAAAFATRLVRAVLSYVHCIVFETIVQSKTSYVSIHYINQECAMDTRTIMKCLTDLQKSGLLKFFYTTIEDKRVQVYTLNTNLAQVKTHLNNMLIRMPKSNEHASLHCKECREYFKVEDCLQFNTELTCPQNEFHTISFCQTEFVEERSIVNSLLGDLHSLSEHNVC